MTLVINQENKEMKKIFFAVFFIFFFLSLLFLFFLRGEVLAAYCGLYGCEDPEEDCNNCAVDCLECPPPPPVNGGWVPCGEHLCPNLVDWVDYKCYPDCSSPWYCQNVGVCPGDVPPGTVCFNDADCFPNNCYCPGGISCEMRCIGGTCLSDCGPGDGNGNGNGNGTNGSPTPPPPNGDPWGYISCDPRAVYVCGEDTGRTTVSWITQNMRTAQVWRCQDNNCAWSDEVLWQTGASGTRNFNDVRSDHSYTFRLYAYDTHGIFLRSCQVLGLCPTCTVSLSCPSTIPLGETSEIVATIDLEDGLVNRVEFSSSNTNVITVLPEGTPLDSIYMTTASGVTEGLATITTNVYLDPGNFEGCSDSCDVNVEIPSWFQTQEGDVHAQGNIYSYVPDGEYFCLDGDGGTPGVVSYSNDYDFKSGSGKGDDRISSTGWLADTSFSRKSYNYFYQLLGSPEEDITGENDGFPTSSGVYFRDGPLNVNNPETVPASLQLVILINGKFTINNRIKVNNGGSLVIISSGDIEVDGSVSELEGIFITDRTISTGNEDNQLIAEGSFIAQSFNLERQGDLLDESEPYEEFHFRPDLILNSLPAIWVSSYTWQELAP